MRIRKQSKGNEDKVLHDYKNDVCDDIENAYSHETDNKGTSKENVCNTDIEIDGRISSGLLKYSIPADTGALKAIEQVIESVRIPLIIHESVLKEKTLDLSLIKNEFDSKPTDFVPIEHVTVADEDVEVDIL